MWTFLRNDGYARVWLLAWLIIDSLPFAFPASARLLSLDGIVLLPLAMVALATGRRALPSLERRFWDLILGGLGFWWLASVLLYIQGLGGPSLRLALGADLAYSLLYLAFFLALETRADGESGDPKGHGRRLEGFGALALVAGFFAYFIVVPAVLNVSHFSTTVPSLSFYAVLGLFLSGRYLRRCLIVTSRRWRILYGGICLATLLLATLDICELLGVLGLLNFPKQPHWDPLWQLPLAILVLTARLRSPEDSEVSIDPKDEPLRSEQGSPLVACGFFFPIVHFGLYSLGWLEVSSRPVRDLIVFFAVFIFGMLALLENSRLRRRSLQLARRHRETARVSEQRSSYLNSLIENSPLAIVVLDAQQLIRICNPAFEGLFGYQQDEIQGTDLDDLISDSRQHPAATGITRQVITGEPVNVTARRLRKDGTVIDVEIHGVPLFTQGELSGVFAIYQDIGERLRSERALKESEERFRLLSEASFEGIVVSDHGVILDVNEQGAKMFGLPVADLIKREIYDFVEPDDLELVQSKLESGFEHPYEHRARRADGKRFLVEVHGRTLPYEGRPLRVTTVRDITEQKRLEEETRQSQKMEVVGRLAGGIAHDFNNILTVITGYGQLLASQLKDPPMVEMAEEIRQAARRASLLTQRLLDFSRKRPPQAEEQSLNALLRGLEKMMRRLLPADIELHLRLDARHDVVRVDPGQMEQMILNLVVNAGDAMPRGGRLILTTLEVELGGEQRVAELEAGSYVRLEVADSGSGMDDETLSHAFDPFFTTKDRGKGTGLGLSTVYNIVQQNRGGITVDSEVEQGTKFRIFLPRVLEPGPQVESAQLDAESAMHTAPDGATVLVVEDESGVRRLAAGCLRTLGYRVLEASDGREALGMIEQRPSIDLVLTDMVMPEMNGPEMVERALALRDDLRILYMTGYADEHLRQRGVIAGSYILQKPFSLEHLAERIREALEQPG